MKQIFVSSLLLLLTFHVNLLRADDKSQEFKDYFDKPLAPIASLVTIKPEYYSDGEGPQSDDIDEDTVDVTPKTTVEKTSKNKSSEFEDYFDKPLAPIASLVTIAPEYYADDEGPQDFADEDSVDVKPKTDDKKEDKADDGDDERDDKSANAKNTEMAVGGLTGFVGKLIKGPKSKELARNATPEQVYIYMSNMFSEEMDKAVLSVLPKVYDYAFELDIEQTCQNALAQIGNTLRAGVLWPTQFIDSSAKIPMNILDGSFLDLGNFDQCLRAVAYETHENNKRVELFDGKYCLVRANLPMPAKKKHLRYSDQLFNYTNTRLSNTIMEYISTFSHHLYSLPLSFGLCIPSTCSPRDIEYLFNNFLVKYQIKVEVEMECNTKKDRIEFTDYQYISLAIIASLAAIVALATVVDVYRTSDLSAKPKHANTVTQLLACFSAHANGKQLFSLKMKNKDLSALNGVKVLAIVWLVVANVYLLGFQPQIKNMIRGVHSQMKLRSESMATQLIVNSWSAAEIFFLISGILVAYTTISQLCKTKGNFNVWKYALFLWIQFTPSMIGAILLLYLFPLIKNGGPIFKSNVTPLVDTCANNWWMNVLYVSNWYTSDQICLSYTWFLSANFQLHLVGIAVLLVVYHKPKYGVSLTAVMVAIGVFVPAIIAYRQKLSATSPLFNRPLIEEMARDAQLIHFVTFNHFSSYFIGIAIGVTLTCPAVQLKVNRFVSGFSWIVLPVLSVGSLLITYKWNNWTREPSDRESIFYYAFNRIAFIAGIAWIVHECLNRRGGYVNAYLSHKLFLPLSRLTYQIFLLNFLVVWLYYFTKRDLIAYNDIEMLLTSGGVLVFTSALAIVTHLLFEAPFVNLYRHVSASSEAVDPTVKDMELALSTTNNVNNVNGSARPQIALKSEHVDENCNVRL